MSNWSVREIRVRFRELLDTVIRNGPQIITRRGRAGFDKGMAEITNKGDSHKSQVRTAYP